MRLSLSTLILLLCTGFNLCHSASALDEVSSESMSFIVQDKKGHFFTIRPVNYEIDLEGIQNLVSQHQTYLTSEKQIDFLETEMPTAHLFSIYRWRDLYATELLGSNPIIKRWVVVDNENSKIVGDFDCYEDNSIDFLISPPYRGNGLSLKVLKILSEYFKSRIGHKTIQFRLKKKLRQIDSYKSFKEFVSYREAPYQGSLAEVNYLNVPSLQICLKTMSLKSINYKNSDVVFEFPSLEKEEDPSLKAFVSSLCSPQAEEREHARSIFHEKRLKYG